VETGFLDGPLDSLPAPEARLFGALITGDDRHHDFGQSRPVAPR
jgi:hypothetical protein